MREERDTGAVGRDGPRGRRHKEKTLKDREVVKYIERDAGGGVEVYERGSDLPDQNFKVGTKEETVG